MKSSHPLTACISTILTRLSPPPLRRCCVAHSTILFTLHSSQHHLVVSAFVPTIHWYCVLRAFEDYFHQFSAFIRFTKINPNGFNRMRTNLKINPPFYSLRRWIQNFEFRNGVVAQHNFVILGQLSMKPIHSLSRSNHLIECSGFNEYIFCTNYLSECRPNKMSVAPKMLHQNTNSSNEARTMIR